MTAWTCHTHPSGRRYWVLDGTDYRIESIGSHTVSAKAGADRGKRVGGGYRPERGRQGLGLFSSLQAAKDRVVRDLQRRAREATERAL